MSKPIYYSGTKLLSLKDLDNCEPDIYMVVSNRTAGKTTWFARHLVKKFLNKGEKFGLLYRYANQLDNVDEKFFKDISGLFFPGHVMESEKVGREYVRLYLDGKPCGYALALNYSTKIKEKSHLFSDISRLFLDEFQDENNRYLPGEIEKFISVHTSIARGQGQQARRVPVYMCSNPVTLLNPYYTALGVTERLNSDTTFLRGRGWVLESSLNLSAADAQRSSGFNKAFEHSRYMAYNIEGIYLNDFMSFISRPPKGVARYICTFKYNGNMYSVRHYATSRICYCDTSWDESYPLKIAVNLTDHSEDFTMVDANPLLIHNLRDYFKSGSFRFKNAESKAALIALIKY